MKITYRGISGFIFLNELLFFNCRKIKTDQTNLPKMKFDDLS